MWLIHADVGYVPVKYKVCRKFRQESSLFGYSPLTSMYQIKYSGCRDERVCMYNLHRTYTVHDSGLHVSRAGALRKCGDCRDFHCGVKAANSSSLFVLSPQTDTNSVIRRYMFQATFKDFTIFDATSAGNGGFLQQKKPKNCQTPH